MNQIEKHKKKIDEEIELIRINSYRILEKLFENPPKHLSPSVLNSKSKWLGRVIVRYEAIWRKPVLALNEDYRRFVTWASLYL